MTVGTQVKQTLAVLEGVQGTLRTYLTQIQDEETKTVFQRSVNTANEIIGELRARIRDLEYEERQYNGF